MDSFRPFIYTYVNMFANTFVMRSVKVTCIDFNYHIVLTTIAQSRTKYELTASIPLLAEN